MPDEGKSLLATLDLEPSAPARLRKGQEKVEWETVRGKINRVEIGIPRYFREEHPGKVEMVTSDDLKEFSPNDYSFYRLNPSFTLLPDEGCRFQKIDFIIDIHGETEDRAPPLILRLRPREITAPRRVVLDKEVSASSGVSDPILKIVNIEMTGKYSRHDELENIMVALQSFGARTKEGGWRFELTDSREIPLSATDIEALIVMPRNKSTKAKFIIEAKISIRTSLDKWLTWAFKSGGPIKAEAYYEFPKSP